MYRRRQIHRPESINCLNQAGFLLVSLFELLLFFSVVLPAPSLALLVLLSDPEPADPEPDELSPEPPPVEDEEAVLDLSPSTRFFLDPLLKSVSYHPLPFRRNADAETSLTSDCFSQLGQTTIGSALTFCNFSSR